MTDKVQIKEEIEKRKQEIWPKNTGEMRVVDTPKPLVQGWLNALDWVLNIIDSIPEEYGCEVNFTTKSEDLEEEIQRAYYDKSLYDADNLDRQDFNNIAYHFADWQKQQMKEVLQTEYEKGRFDMREEMMQDAIECVVEDWCGDSPEITIPLNPQDFKTGDKVKIIICKTE